MRRAIKSIFLFPHRSIVATFYSLICLLSFISCQQSPLRNQIPQSNIPDNIPGEIKIGIEKLYSSNPVERYRGIDELCDPGRDREAAIAFLIAELGDNAEVRIKNIAPVDGNPYSVDFVTNKKYRVVEVSYVRVKDHVREMLPRMGQPTILPLIQEFNNEDPWIAEAAIAIVKEVLFTNLLNKEVSAACLSGLNSIISSSYEHKNQTIRNKAVEAASELLKLGCEIGSADSNLYARLLDHGSYGARIFVAKRLGACGFAIHNPGDPIFRLISDENADVRKSALIAIWQDYSLGRGLTDTGEITEKRADITLNAFKDTDFEVRKTAIEVLKNYIPLFLNYSYEERNWVNVTNKILSSLFEVYDSGELQLSACALNSIESIAGKIDGQLQNRLPKNVSADSDEKNQQILRFLIPIRERIRQKINK